MNCRIFAVRWIAGLSLILTFALAGCGKVTQEVAAKNEKKDNFFTISYDIAVLSTANIRTVIKTAPDISSNNYFSIYQPDVYTVVYGLKPGNKWEQLAWGKAALTMNSGKWIAKALNASNVTIDKANLGEAFMEWSAPTVNSQIWRVRSTKLAFGYPYYLFQTFTDANRFTMILVDDKTASTNAVLSKGLISQYDTFITILYLTILNRYDLSPSTTTWTPARLQSLFSSNFFNELHYSLPQNTSQTFTPEKPTFTWNRKLEKELVKIAELVEGADKVEAKRYVNESTTLTLTKKARELLTTSIDALPALGASSSANSPASSGSTTAPSSVSTSNITAPKSLFGL